MPGPDEPASEFERGKEAGRVAAILAEHGQHLAKINGSVGDAARSLAELAAEVRSLREEAKLRDERVATFLAALATETEHRRSTLADSATAGAHQQRRSRRVLIWALVVAVVLAAAAVLLSIAPLAN